VGTRLELLKETVRRSGPAWTASLALDRLGIPALRWWSGRTIGAQRLEQQVSSVLRSWGMSDPDVAVATGHIVYPDLHGIDSHGCGMLLQYQRWLDQGLLNMRPEIRIVTEDETTALIDGGGSLGHVPADRAMRLAIEKCASHGLAAVAVRNSNHFGAAGSYAAIAAERGLIGLATTNVRVPALVPTHGTEAKLGTNPIAFAAPGLRNRPFLLDMSTSTVPVGKLATAWRTGRPIPRGWALDRAGRPVTQPRKAIRLRRVTPLGGERATGGHKGYGLATMVEILSAVLPGAFGGVGHFFLAIQPQRFLAGDGFGAALDTLLDGLRASGRRDPGQPVQVAGDPEHAAAERIAATGITLSRATVEDIRAVCAKSGAPFLLDRCDEVA